MCYTYLGFGQHDILPKWMTEEEKINMKDYVRSVIEQNLETRTPDLPMRSIAEWEELSGIAIAWSNYFSQIQAQIVEHAKEEVVVYIVTDNENDPKSILDAYGVDFSQNVEFINAPYNSLWIRDYGPNSVYINDVDSLAFVDWIYNRNRPSDDLVSMEIGSFLDIPVFSTTSPPLDLVHTGGNYMTDGLGSAFSSQLVLEENGPGSPFGFSDHSEDAVDSIMNTYMGIDVYPKFINLPYDAIHHIDMHMKMIDEETFIFGQYPEGVADGPQIEANILYLLDSFSNAYGKDYNIVRIPMVPDAFGDYPDVNGDYRTYANAMFINKTVLVPTYEEKYDTTALRIWQELLPGHKIVGINSNKIIPLSGALHCIIKEIGVRDPLWITLEKIEDQEAPDILGYTLDARIKHRDGIDQAFLYYRYNDQAYFDSIQMTSIDDIWSATIPEIDSAYKVSYYIHAIANNGHEISRPITGAKGAWNFTISRTSATIDHLALNVQSPFPNPSNGITVIPVEVDNCMNLHIELLDMSGRLVKQIFTGSQCQDSRRYYLDVSELQVGVYIVEIKSGSGTVSKKLLVY
jgi:agmatine/peptidylarginine deiminase